ncbi:MAG: NAD(P)-binding domain-containing protein [Emcibacteraceae bacterium]|nr:NAD(P)-binding domain-containing protein [Emcibacteraceae bacterium]
MSKNIKTVDYLIIGAGPAGLQLGYYLEKRDADYLIVEENECSGSFFTKFPRHRTLISINKTETSFNDSNKNLRWDWNSLLTDYDGLRFSKYSKEYFPKADDLVNYLNDFSNKYQLNISYKTKVLKISKKEKFLVTTSSNEVIQANKLILATGLPKENIPMFEGVNHCEFYGECSINPDDYIGQRVMVVGKGNSGSEFADSLVSHAAVVHMISPTAVRLAWQTHYVGDLRAVNNNILDTYQLKSQNTILDADIKKINKLEDGKLCVDIAYSHAQNQKIKLIVDKVILCAGFRMDSTIFDAESCFVQIDHKEKYPILNSSWESVSVSDMYFIGTLMHGRDFRVGFSGFIHGFRYNIKFLNQILQVKYDGGVYSDEYVPFDILSLRKFIINRVDCSSALFQQPKVFCDFIKFNIDDRQFEIQKSCSVDYVFEKFQNKSEFSILLTMEYGVLAEGVDPFNNHRDPLDGENSQFIHPVIRLYSGSKIVSTYHVPEDLENIWDTPFYTDPLDKYLTEILATCVGDNSCISDNSCNEKEILESSEALKS